ncbi:glycosyltransferase, partial [Flavobacterium sp.]
GILHSKGEYITHVDSDDWLHKTALEKMIIAADSSKADIVIAKYFRVMDRYGVFQKASPYNIPNDLILDSQSFIRDYFIGFFGVNRFSISMWAKLYKKSFIDKIEITIGGFDLGEDLNYNIQVFPKANIIHFIDSPIYFYRFGGMTTKLNEKIIESALSMFNLKKKMIVEYNKPEYNKWIIIEMVNYIKSFVKMMIEYKRNDPVFINTSLNELFSRPEIYDVIEYSRNLENFKNDNFVKALQRQDIDTMLEIQAVVYKKEKFRKSLIRTVSNCLK